MSDLSRLPARPSLEQLQKQAKELLRLHKSGDAAAAERFRIAGAAAKSLTDAQFVLAREHGFESWPKLKRYVEGVRSPELAKFEKLAEIIAAAYSTGDVAAIRELNWDLGVSFTWDHQPGKMRQRLVTWCASQSRAPELALADARAMVARSYGFTSWALFVESVANKTDAPAGAGRKPPFYQIDWKENSIGVRGPMSDRDWEALCEVMRDHQIPKLVAGGMSDAGLERVARLPHVTGLLIGNSNLLTDEGLLHLARMPQVRELGIGGPRSELTDRGLRVLAQMGELRRFSMSWTPKVSDVGVAHLAACEHLENVDLMGTPTGDGAIRALGGKANLRSFKTGRGVTDAGLPLLHQFPAFKTWQGGEAEFDLMAFEARPNHLMIDGPFTDRGLAGLVGLDGLAGLSFFWHCPDFTSAGLAGLKHLANLQFLGCQGKNCDDEAMRHIEEIPRLRMLMGQGTVATDAGFAALSRSQTLEYFWGRECRHLTGRGFVALASMPALRGLGVSCKNVDDDALAALPRFPSLRQLMPMDVSDEGFRHIGRCAQLEKLTCMYCRDTGDIATDHIAGLTLKNYYAGQTKITDRSLEVLGRMQSLESVELWACAGVTDAGVAHLATLPRLREMALDGLAGVTREAAGLFPAPVRVRYSG